MSRGVPASAPIYERLRESFRELRMQSFGYSLSVRVFARSGD